jgi:hypothetical protein
MRKIDLDRIIDAYGLNNVEVAMQLFPGNAHPGLALNRIKKGVAVLDADQISKLALMAGIPISALYAGGQWRKTFKSGIHKFTNGKFTAELSTVTFITKIFHNESLFHESLIASPTIALSEYFEKLDLEILKFKENE